MIKHSSIIDIARIAQVSAMTVSRVLNEPAKVAKATRERVEKAMRTSGYRKDVYASINSKKRGKRAERVVIFNGRSAIDSESAHFPFFAPLFLGLINEVMGRNVRIVLTDPVRDENHFINNVGGCDAVICAGDIPASVNLHSRIGDSTPVISLCAGLSSPYTVEPDDDAGGRMAAEHALSQGHCSTAVLYSHDSANQRTRAESFSSHIAAQSSANVISARIEPKDGHLLHDASIRDALTYCLNANPRPTLFFVPNGFTAFRVFSMLGERSLTIPRDIGFIGYDNCPFYDYIATPLTRICYEFADAGAAAGRLLLSVLNEALPSQTKVIIPVRMIDKASAVHLEERL